ncbi:exonuclease SbcCD subunit D [Gemella cuniculi]|uniref:exonuclease SbcCD subunit D n=1 Tax=Gemella cuniculi TaxID=150240 RepID=UPI00040E09AC|nr:exonuclease SbcCD subunit D [Gemella cuniculi]
MKFLHTADWHIGRKLQGVDLLEEQKYILEKLIETIKEHNPDFLIIAGDLYDRSVPSREATALLQQILVEINIECALPIFAISGNHDSRERLSVGEAWFSQHSFYLHTEMKQVFSKIEFGNADIYMLPYFEPYEAREYFSDDTLTSHHLATKRVIDEIYKNMDDNKINILIAHTFVAGSLETDSEREISVGTVENVAVDVFEKFDYVALGHLHNPNAASSDRIKYSGSPLAYSFGEANQIKGVRIVEITKDRFDEKFLPLEPRRKMYNIVADYNEIFSKKYQEKFDCKNGFFSMELSGLEGITDPMPRIKEFYPNTLLLKAKSKKSDNNNTSEVTKEVLTKSPFELIENFYKEQVNEELTDKQKETLIKIIGEVEVDEAN